MPIQHGLLSPLDEQVDFLVGWGGRALRELRRGRLGWLGFDGDGDGGVMGPKEHERRGASGQHTHANRDRLPGNLWTVARRKLARAAAVAQERHAGIDFLASTLE